ncbi:hypothetical protein PM082_015676 [Marasmius tenuissimus]|nr:hypothetical protein PM082_015676 [Marasmius tenuissimus]
MSSRPILTLDGFVAIGEGIYLRKPTTTTTGRDQDPNVILIFGWMGAKLGHLQKYTKVHEEMYPDATQVVVRNEPGFFLSREATRQRNLRPVVEVLEAVGCIPKNRKENGETTRPRILIHSFSNGGASQLYTLAKLLQSRGIAPLSYTPTTKPISALIIDSSPASGAIRTGSRAFTLHIRRAIFRIPLQLTLAFLFVLRWLFDKLTGTPPPFETLKRMLNSPHTLPWMDEKTPRTYMYSKKDELVPFEEVDEHVRKGREVAGLVGVRNEVFETARHVDLARTEPGRYWGTTSHSWENNKSRDGGGQSGIGITPAQSSHDALLTDHDDMLPRIFATGYQIRLPVLSRRAYSQLPIPPSITLLESPEYSSEAHAWITQFLPVIPRKLTRLSFSASSGLGGLVQFSSMSTARTNLHYRISTSTEPTRKQLFGVQSTPSGFPFRHDLSSTWRIVYPSYKPSFSQPLPPASRTTPEEQKKIVEGHERIAKERRRKEKTQRSDVKKSRGKSYSGAWD